MTNQSAIRNRKPVLSPAEASAIENRESRTILLVEDNPDDVLLARRALRKASVANPVQIVEDGAAAIAYLAGQGDYADRERYPLPVLVVLDLKLPRKSGFEVLAWLREQSQFKNLPVVVLTSSKESTDADHAYALGANSYLVKPLTPEAVWDTMKMLSLYWTDVLLMKKEEET